MISVLIVDDEPLIGKGITAMIPWEELGLTPVGLAENGQEALEIIRKDLPDIVITDIRMPVMDGLELIGECAAENLSAHFILLTGYKEFDYAKRAMQYGVRHYILKPTDPELLKQALEAEISEIKNERDQIASKKCMEDRYKKVALKAAEQYWRECLKFNRVFEKELALYVPVEDQSHECVCVVMDIEENALFFEQFILKYLTYEILFSKYRVFCTVLGNQVVVIIEHGPDRQLLMDFRQIRQLFYGYLGKNVVISVSPRGSYGMVPKLYERATAALNKSFWCSAEDILLPNGERVEAEEKNSPVDISRYKKQMAVGSVDVMEQVILSALADIRDNRGSMEEGKQLLLQLYVMAKNYLDMNSGGIDLYDVEYIIQAKTFRVVERIFENLFDEYRAAKKTNVPVGQRTIERMKLLIEENLSEEDLSLKWLARNFLFMNEEYLGKLFIQHLGIRFSAYVTQLRIAEAKRLLNQEEIKITELSRRVGFGKNSAYFSTVFKNEVGLSPSEYRNSVLNTM